MLGKSTAIEGKQRTERIDIDYFSKLPHGPEKKAKWSRKCLAFRVIATAIKEVKGLRWFDMVSSPLYSFFPSVPRQVVAQKEQIHTT